MTTYIGLNNIINMDGSQKKSVKKSRVWATIDSELYDRFNKYCDNSGYERSKLLELIIRKFMDVNGGE